MSKYEISCTVGTTDPTAKLGLEIWVDNHVLFDCDHITHETLPLVFELDEDETQHELRFVMKGKTADHTTINEAGEIVKDACLTINKLAFDEIEIYQIITNKVVYTHDFNGTGTVANHKFYDTMGCNGTLSLEFSTPVYLWLLEVM